MISRDDKLAFLQKALPAAIAAKHVYEDYAVCEAALESAWGTSGLAVKANNLFGQKLGFSSLEYPIIDIGTNEVIKGVPIHLNHTQWPMFPDWTASFAERMELLQRAKDHAGEFIYHDALAAQDGETFVRLVSIHWATDPARAEKVLLTYRVNRPLIETVKSLIATAVKGATANG